MEYPPVTIQHEIDAKYDLSGDAYVVVLHHRKFERAEDRHGSEADMAKVREFFRFYRTEPADLEVYEDLKAQEVRLLMETVSRKDFSANCCLIVVIMSHGSVRDTVIANDRQPYLLNQDVLLKVSENETLAGKPKLFIVNACRGSEREPSSARQVPGVLPVDTVLLQSSFEGHLSYRHVKRGSLFMQSLFDRLRASDHLHIGEVYKKLLNPDEQARREKIQTPSMSSSLTHRLILADLRKEPPPGGAAQSVGSNLAVG